MVVLPLVVARKAEAEARKRTGEKVAQRAREGAQSRRSDVFAAARGGDADRVRKGVWEDGVDAAGGEVKRGHGQFVKAIPADPFQTLLHIAASRGDAGLVEWLNAHSESLFNTGDPTR